jgi:hypothetical protein
MALRGIGQAQGDCPAAEVEQLCSLILDDDQKRQNPAGAEIRVKYTTLTLRLKVRIHANPERSCGLPSRYALGRGKGRGHSGIGVR